MTEADGKPAPAIDAIVYVVGFPEKPDPNAPRPRSRRRAVTSCPTSSRSPRARHPVPDDDPFLHNVFSQSAARKFDLGSFKKGEYKDTPFPDTGVIDVYCNIHPEMAATILVLPNRRHTRTTSAGAFTLEGVPPGKSIVSRTRAAPPAGELEHHRDVRRRYQIDLKLVRGAEPNHLDKYSEKYKDSGATVESPSGLQVERHAQHAVDHARERREVGVATLRRCLCTHASGSRRPRVSRSCARPRRGGHRLLLELRGSIAPAGRRASGTERAPSTAS